MKEWIIKIYAFSSFESLKALRLFFKKKVIAHKHFRKIHLGENVTLIFEDELTMRYQIQEMLRIEKIFEEEGIQDELNAYNPLVPNGNNWKSTMLIEYPNAEDRKLNLSNLIGIEDNVYVKIEGFDRVYAIADEDLDRENTTEDMNGKNVTEDDDSEDDDSKDDDSKDDDS